MEKDHKIVKESYKLPSDRKSLVALIETILSKGGVQKLTVQVGKEIAVNRAVKDLSNDLPKELLDDDLMSTIRNTELEVFGSQEKLSPYEYMFKAIQLISRREARPKAIIVHTVPPILTWLNLPKYALEESHNELFGIEVITHKNMSDDSIIIVAESKEEPDAILFSLKLELA